jgi:hypothetical protein
MLTDKQITKLTSDFLMHDTVYEWSRYHTCDVEWDKLTVDQKYTLLTLADMNVKEQSKYCVIDDVLVESTTKKQLYALINGEWILREQIRYHKK